MFWLFEKVIKGIVVSVIVYYHDDDDICGIMNMIMWSIVCTCKVIFNCVP